MKNSTLYTSSYCSANILLHLKTVISPNCLSRMNSLEKSSQHQHRWWRKVLTTASVVEKKSYRNISGGETLHSICGGEKFLSQYRRWRKILTKASADSSDGSLVTDSSASPTAFTSAYVVILTSSK